jgi:O-acetyl-ADP-ribose deacetylase (regulator of RNase III)
MKYIKGDLIKDALQFDVITHGCNCFCNMGSGIAPQIKESFPEAWEKDKATIKGDRSKLGTITYTMKTKPTVINSYTQFGCNRQNINIDYDAVRGAMRCIKKLFSGKKIGMPKIGAGLARGDWEIIELIINEELGGEDVTVVIWDKNATLVEAETLLGGKTND